MLRKTAVCFSFALATALVSASTLPADAATFYFSFDGAKGFIYGLPLDGVRQPATQVEVIGVGTFIGNPTYNQFTTVGGQITGDGSYYGFVFDSYRPPSASSASGSHLSFTIYREGIIGGFSNAAEFVEYDFSPVYFELVSETPASVPEPSMLWGAVGLGAIALAQRRLSSTKQQAK
ncbi:MAG: hypothetical protein HC800_11415 [Phormidesmis sp. RL_2_1]|nr:hypothetical protein [Phormidesmis sp. RL_2_1]